MSQITQFFRKVIVGDLTDMSDAVVVNARDGLVHLTTLEL